MDVKLELLDTVQTCLSLCSLKVIPYNVFTFSSLGFFPVWEPQGSYTFYVVAGFSQGHSSKRIELWVTICFRIQSQYHSHQTSLAEVVTKSTQVQEQGTWTQYSVGGILRSHCEKSMQNGPYFQKHLQKIHSAKGFSQNVPTFVFNLLLNLY